MADPVSTTTPIYDISGDSPVLGDMPHEQVQDAIASGNYSFPKGQTINVVSPDGTYGTVPAEQAGDAIKNGFQYATPTMLSSHADEQHYTEPGQQVLAGLEGAVQGVAGPLAPATERALGVNPEDIRKRAEYNPWTHGLSEAAGFTGGLFTGASEAAVLGKAGELAAQGANVLTRGAMLGSEVAGPLTQGANVAQRLAAGGAKMAAEMGLFQVGDEATKAILQDPNQTVGSAATNVGLSTLLGGVVGVPLTGIGVAAKSAVNSQLLKDFTSRLEFRGSNVNPNELMEKEFNDAIGTYHAMNDELLGPTGLKAQALINLMPEKMTPEITNQIEDLNAKGQSALQSMIKKQVPERYINKFIGDMNGVQEALTNPQVSPGQAFDALNDFKQTLQGYSKGNFGPFAIPSYHEAYDFLNITKSLGHDVRTALEDSTAWGKVADLQKNLNKSWTEVLPAVKDAQSKFMEKVGGEYVPSPQKFSTYVNQNGKATTETIRQKMMGNFVESLSNHFDQIDNIYEHAGLENPYPKVSMNALQESLNRPSIGSKLADLWYTRLGPHGLGELAGGGVGFALGHATGIPEAGFGGAYLGKWVLGPVFSSLIKPLMEKGASMPAFRQSIAYAKAVMDGSHALTNSVGNMFGAAAKTVPSHLWPEPKHIETLDKKLKDTASNPSALLNVAGDMGKYLPDHAQALAQSSMNAVNYLNSLRPNNPKLSPLDSDIPVSKAQTSAYHRQLEIAEQPLMAIEHAKDGTLLPQDVQTLKTIYPNFYNKMSQEIMNAMGDHISKENAVPYRLKQSLSLLLGQPLDSTMTPQAIQSIQAMYAPKPQAPQGAPKRAPKNTNKMGKISEDHYTAEQAAQKRQTAWD